MGPDGDELARLVTHLIRVPTDDTEGPSLAVGTVLGIGGTVTPTEADELSLDAADTTQALATIDALTEHPSVALTVDPVPAVLAALEGTSTSSADPSPVDALAGHLAGRQVLVEPYVRLDLGAWVAARLDPELDVQLAQGATTTAELLGVTPDGRTTVADPTLTPEALRRLDGLGLDQVVVPTDQLVDPPTTDVTFTDVFELAVGDGSSLSAVTADPDLAGRLRATDDPVLNAHLVLADLAVLYNDRPGESRGVALDLGTDTDPQTLTTLLAGLAQPAPPDSDGRPMVSPVTLDDLFRVTEAAEDQSGATDLVLDYRSDPPTSLGDYPSELRAAERQVTGYRSLTEPASPTLAEGLARALLLSGAISLDAAERADILDTVTTRIDAATSEIVAPLQQYVTLTSRSGKIPLNLENRLPYPVRIHLVLDSVKLEFPAGNVIDVELPAAATTRLDVEVTTRASGAFPLEVGVRSPDEVLDITSTSFTVRSTAISGAGLVLSIGAGVFLLVWWGRHFRKVRRARQLVASDHPVFGEPDPTR
nr:DUF6049 family protein [Rhabdothermincola salaria]